MSDSRESIEGSSRVYGPIDDPRRVFERSLDEIDCRVEHIFISNRLYIGLSGLRILACAFRQLPGRVPVSEVYSELSMLYKVDREELQELGLGRIIKSAEQAVLTHGDVSTAEAHNIDRTNRYFAAVSQISSMPEYY